MVNSTVHPASKYIDLPVSPAPFEIRISGQIVISTLRGMWDLETLQAFIVSVSASERRVKAAFGGFYSLCHLDEFPVQQQQIVAEFHRYMTVPAPGAIKTAIVVSSALKRRQVERAAPGELRRIFQFEAEALAWLQATG